MKAPLNFNGLNLVVSLKKGGLHVVFDIIFLTDLINIYWRNICTELNLHYITLLTLLDITPLITLLYLLD